ncbi:MAG: HEAT repeat domain-containing protein, partial [Actinomycetota bacterium]|nr:HEAT repeat domain-containing protein [Actinomycetota bacterium]
ESVTFCELEGKLLINDFCLDERDQSRPNTVSFLRELARWEARSITFERGLTDEDLRGFLEVFSRKRGQGLEEGLSALLSRGGVEHVRVDEKIYVSIGKDQELSSLGGGSEAGAMEMLRDEVFVRFLVGNLPALDVPPGEVAGLLSDPQRVKATFQAVMLGFKSSGGEVGAEKARLIKDTVDRMFTLVESLADEGLRETLSEEMVNILAALEPETLVEVLSEETPQALNDAETRREIISSVEGENVLLLADQVIEKYHRLLDEKASMDPEDFRDISAVLNEIVADLYAESDPQYHAGITERLQRSGLLSRLAEVHPQAGKDMEAYSVIARIRDSGSLRPLEGLDDDQVIEVATKLLEMGERGWVDRITAVTARNLESERPDFRLRAARFLDRMYRCFRRLGFSPVVVSDLGWLLGLLDREDDPEVKRGMLRLLGDLAGASFAEGRGEDFMRACRTLLRYAESGGECREAAEEALGSLDPWEVGKPLLESLFKGDENMASLAAGLLLRMKNDFAVEYLVDRLKGEEEMEVTPGLAQFCRCLGDPLISALSEILESNAREEVYVRVLRLLEGVGGNAALALAKPAVRNPIPEVRKQALRSLAMMSPGDPALLPLFLQALRDEAPEVRREAVRGLGTIDDAEAVDALLGILQGKSPLGEEHPGVEEAACLALARLGPEKALGPLQDILRRRTFSIRRRSVHPRVKAAACYALGQIGGPGVVGLIRQYLDDPDPILRNEARKALASCRRRGLTD